MSLEFAQVHHEQFRTQISIRGEREGGRYTEVKKKRTTRNDDNKSFDVPPKSPSSSITFRNATGRRGGAKNNDGRKKKWNSTKPWTTSAAVRHASRDQQKVDRVRPRIAGSLSPQFPPFFGPFSFAASAFAAAAAAAAAAASEGRDSKEPGRRHTPSSPPPANKGSRESPAAVTAASLPRASTVNSGDRQAAIKPDPGLSSIHTYTHRIESVAGSQKKRNKNKGAPSSVRRLKSMDFLTILVIRLHRSYSGATSSLQNHSRYLTDR